MFNRRYRRYSCMNNCCDESANDMIEEKCSNIYSCDDMEEEVDCECGFDEGEVDVFPINPMLGQSYVPIQYMDKTFKPQIGLKMGTIFPELVSPYYPCQSMQEIAYLETTNKIGEGCNTCRKRIEIVNVTI